MAPYPWKTNNFFLVSEFVIILARQLSLSLLPLFQNTFGFYPNLSSELQFLKSQIYSFLIISLLHFSCWWYGQVFFFFNIFQRIIALQCCVVFCHTMIWISYKYTNIPSLLTLPPTPPHSTPQSVTEHQVALPVLHSNLLLAVLHMVMYMFQRYSLNLSCLLLPHCVHKSVFYVCVSIPALQISSSFHFPKFHIYVLI